MLRFAIFLRSQNDYYFTANNRKTAFKSKNNVGTNNAGGKKDLQHAEGGNVFSLNIAESRIVLEQFETDTYG